jgi:cytoskeletal protein CcmA (bactofilin family)
MFQKPSANIALSKTGSNLHNSKKDDVETVVGPSVMVEGDFASEGNILVKGVVSGSVKTSTLLTVEKGAKILASVRAADAFISGEIKGNVRVSGRLELTESARVAGDVVCQTLVVAAGALVHGKIAMKGIHIDVGAKGASEKRTSTHKAKEKNSEHAE